MLVYAGIDEAGYGPLLGPLVVARSVFTVETEMPAGALPSLWTIMRVAVCRRAGDVKRRVAINDSKLLYNPAVGLRHLERGVLSFLHANAVQPATLEDLLAHLAHDSDSREVTRAWYRDSGCGPSLPCQAAAPELTRAAARVARACERTGVRLADSNAAVIFEDRFNRLVHDSRSKAACTWRFVSGHLSAIWEQYGEQHPRVVVDRQGGRVNYLELLSTLFPWTQLRLIRDHPRVSAYEVSEGARRMEIAFIVESERDHLPVAYASMTAKYIRELFMTRFKAFWQEHAPEVRASAGYFGDGRRFLREIEPTLARLGIDRRELARAR